MSKQPVIDVQNLSVSFDEQKVVKNINFQIHKNEILGLVGESGSGKSITSLAMTGLLPKNAKITGHIQFSGYDLISINKKAFRKLRGRRIAMIFQEPMSSLNPSMKCGLQVAEMIAQHQQMRQNEIKKKVLALFDQVKLPQPDLMYQSYPHQISGGQKQRVMIAMAIACQPDLLIADEPTTALDVTVQCEIVDLLKELLQQTGMALLFITHDLELVAGMANRVAVMYQGELVEINQTQKLFDHPKTTYTKALLASKPKKGNRLKRLPTIKDVMDKNIPEDVITDQQRRETHQQLYQQQPLLEIDNLSKTFYKYLGYWKGKQKVKAVDEVSLKLYPGETLGLVGESGCGKSTLANLILQLEEPGEGILKYKDKNITALNKAEQKRLRKDIQLIFQDPFSSLNPRMSIGKAIMEPIIYHGLAQNKVDARQKTLALLREVGLSADMFNRYPHEFSGGQRQRIGIARSIAVEPELIICDESVAALDISVQAQVLNLLNRLKKQYGFSYLFIAHDLKVVHYMADQLYVMHQGKMVEHGDADEVFYRPQKNYTQKLIKAIPGGWE
ncbi:MAG: ABC transporter ATP-binding protein [Psychroflexus sp.]|nr:ABC transporter ATP-binding protein [Psychroflexus sp.]